MLTLPTFDDVAAAAARLAGGTVALAVVTATGDEETARTAPLRKAALASGVTCFTTAALAKLGVSALEEDGDRREDVRSLQEWYEDSR